jgi:hypothetical protein
VYQRTIQLLALPSRQLRVEERLGTPGRFQPGFLGQRIRRIGAASHLELLRPVRRALRERYRVLVVEEGLHGQPDTSFGHQLRGGFVHQLAVVDDPDTGLDRRLDRTRGIRRHAHIPAPVFRRFHGGTKLFLSVLRYVQGGRTV